MQANNEYMKLVADIKDQIVRSRYAATRLANQEQLKLYFAIGMMLHKKITNQQWGAKVLEQIANDLKMQMPALRGFSHRNLKNMRQFFTVYIADPIGKMLMSQLQIFGYQTGIIGQLPTAQLNKQTLEAFLGISFTHHLLLLNKCSHAEERLFYMYHAAVSFWSVAVMEHHIEEKLFQQQGKLPNNFESTIAAEMHLSAIKLFKDEYLLDFLNLKDDDDERRMESEIVTSIRDFILRMGKGFAFIGNQFKIEVGGQEFFIDLLFFNRILQSMVVFELKKTHYKPEHSGQLNFYLNVLDDKIKLPNENPSIGIILCKEKNDTVVHFSIRSINKPMGVATYKTSTEIPKIILDVFPDTDKLKKLL